MLDRDKITPALLEKIGLLLALVLYAATILAYLDFVPIWDGLTYSRDCLVRAVSTPFSLLRFNCFSHPTMAYVLLVALPQYLDTGNVALLHCANMLLGLGSIVAFFFLLRRLFPRPEAWAERLVVTMVYAGYPLLLANTVNMNPDFGVLVFFLITLCLIVHRRLVLATAAGLFLVFSKEPGILLYGCILGAYGYFYVARSGLDGKQRLVKLLKLWPLCFPVVLFLAFYVYKSLMAGPVLWDASDAAAPKKMFESFTSFSLTDPTFLGYARGILLINFNWIMSLFVTALLVTRAAQYLLKLKRTEAEHCHHRSLGLVLALFFLAFFLLTRFPTYTNLRYVLPVYPLLIVFFYHALCVFFRSRRLRLVVLSATFLVSYGSSFVTFDPVSRQAYGTFKFGSMDMLKMATVTGECCGYGRDQLVYNLQFTRFDELVTRIFQDLKPTRDTVILAHSGFRNVETPQADFQLVGFIHKKTYERTLLPQDNLGLKTRRLRRLVLWKKKPPVIYYMELPNFDSTRELLITNSLYRVEWVRRYGDPAYFIRVFKFRLRRRPARAASRPRGPYQ